MILTRIRKENCGFEEKTFIRIIFTRVYKWSSVHDRTYIVVINIIGIHPWFGVDTSIFSPITNGNHSLQTLPRRPPKTHNCYEIKN